MPTWMPTAMPASELQRQIALYLDDLARAGNSAHSIRAYDADLRQFLGYLSPPDLAPPAPSAIDLLLLREWLASLYRDQLAAVTLRRKLAAVRGLFRFMPVSYTHLRAHETRHDLVCRLLLEKK